MGKKVQQPEWNHYHDWLKNCAKFDILQFVKVKRSVAESTALDGYSQEHVEEDKLALEMLLAKPYVPSWDISLVPDGIRLNNIQR